MLKFFKKFSAALIIPLIALFLIGCSGEPKIEYREKLVPVKCQIQKTQLPAYTGILEKDIPNILVYTEILESDLAFCRKGGQ